MYNREMNTTTKEVFVVVFSFPFIHRYFPCGCSEKFRQESGDENPEIDFDCLAEPNGSSEVEHQIPSQNDAMATTHENHQLKDSLSVTEGNTATCSEHVSINTPVICINHVELVQEQLQLSTHCQPEAVPSVVQQTDDVALEHSGPNTSSLSVPKESLLQTMAENSSILSQYSEGPPSPERDVHIHTRVAQKSSSGTYMFGVQAEGQAVPTIPEVVVHQQVHEAKDCITATSATGTKSKGM